MNKPSRSILAALFLATLTLTIGHHVASGQRAPNRPVREVRRPQPPTVTPGGSPGAPPADATVLFDGKDLAKWIGPGGQGTRFRNIWVRRLDLASGD